MGGKGSGRTPKGKRLIEKIEEALASDDGEVVEEMISGEEAEVYDKYNKIRQKLGGTEAGKVKIKRWRKDGTLATLVSLPFEGFDEDVLAQHYGGGKYVLTFYKGDEYLGSDIVTLDDSLKPGLPEAVPSVVPHGGMSPESAMMLGQMKGFEALIQAQGVMMQGLLTALAGKKGEEKDPLDVGLKIAEIIKGAGRGGDGAPSVKEMIGDMAETFREGIKFGQLAHAPVEKGFGDVIEALVPPVTKALEAAASQGRVAAPAPAPRAVRPPAQPEAPPVDLSKAPWLVHLRPFINEIATWAKQGWDPEAYVISMLARLPDNVLDEIEAASHSVTFIEDALASLPAPFQAYRAWLTKALEAIKVQVAPEGPALVEEDEDEDGGGGGQ